MIIQFDGHEIIAGKTLKVNVSVANTRLFLGNIPKSKTKEEILEELKKHAGDFAGSFEPTFYSFVSTDGVLVSSVQYSA